MQHIADSTHRPGQSFGSRGPSRHPGRDGKPLTSWMTIQVDGMIPILFSSLGAKSTKGGLRKARSALARSPSLALSSVRSCRLSKPTNGGQKKREANLSGGSLSCPDRVTPGKKRARIRRNPQTVSAWDLTTAQRISPLLLSMKSARLDASIVSEKAAVECGRIEEICTVNQRD